MVTPTLLSRSCSLLWLAVALAAPGLAHGDEPTVDTSADDGWRFQAALGYPTGLAIGTGYKTADGTELLVNAGVLGHEEKGAFATVEAAAQWDVFRGAGSVFHLGVAGSVMSVSTNDPGCTDCLEERRRYYFAGPRIGVRWRIGPPPGPGTTGFLRHHYIDVSGGPMYGVCRGQCEGRRLLAPAVVGRLVFTF